MGYSIYIGEATIFTEEDEIWVGVKKIEHPDAPYWESSGGFPDASEKTNGRHPSYTQFVDFCRSTGLANLFFDEDYGLLRDHPGIKRIYPHHLEEISRARKRWEELHPNAVPGWNVDKGEDPILARLIWYEWWFRWALENCKLPAIYNF